MTDYNTQQITESNNHINFIKAAQEHLAQYPNQKVCIVFRTKYDEMIFVRQTPGQNNLETMLQDSSHMKHDEINQFVKDYVVLLNLTTGYDEMLLVRQNPE